MNRQRSNNNFNQFKELLRSRLSAHEPRALIFPGYAPAAVMILFMQKDGEPHVLLTRRTDKVKTHKGQMSLPGGGYDDTDSDILTTAYRETLEEVGIPEDKIEYLGKFDDFISISGFLVSTFVGAVEYPVEYTFNEDEIDDYLEVPISLFVERRHSRIEYYTFENRQFKVYYYHYRNFEIWGLTARILTDFAEIILSGANQSG
ncbi:MAG: CoA pyrophosphatase [Spirochaetes bacterium]|nr:CoA pyrophosphatase [Spirochaetota bacterium]